MKRVMSRSIFLIAASIFAAGDRGRRANCKRTSTSRDVAGFAQRN